MSVLSTESLRGRLARRGTTPAVVVLILGLVLAFGLVRLTRADELSLSAAFPRVVGLYPGDDVRILGVPVGHVEKIDRDGDRVLVRMKVERGVKVPAGASAVIIAPTLVSGRYVQLTPAYTSGAAMAQGAVIPAARTEVPIEFDELKSALNRFGGDLGPDGNADGTGPLGRAVDTAAANLDGRGQSMHDTLTELSKAVGTLADSRGDIFLTVRNLAEFTQMLADTDSQLRGFTTQMGDLTGQLAASRTLLTSTLKQLNALLPQLQTYLATDRPLVRTTTTQLKALSTLLERNRQNVADILQVAPTAISNAYNIWDPGSHSTVGALILPYQASPSQVVCWLMGTVGAAQQCKDLGPLLDQLDQGQNAQNTTTGGVGALLNPGGAK